MNLEFDPGDLLQVYGDAGRVYHNLDHIRRMLAELNRLCVFKLIDARQASLLHAAIWLHDAVHDLKLPSGVSEARSAELAAARLAHWPPSARQQVQAMILATGHHTRDQANLPPETQWLLDLDLMGLSAEAFSADTQSVVDEHARAGIAPDQIHSGLRQWAKAMLSRRRIYYRPEYVDRELPARRNLEALLS